MVRGERGNAGREWAGVSVPVMRITDEERVLVAVTIIDSPAQLLARVRRRRDSSEPRDRRQVRLHDVDAELIRVFEVKEEMELVFFDRAAQYKSSLPPGEEGIICNRGPTQARIGRHIVIAEIKISGAVEIVAAAARNDVDGPESRDARRKIEVRARKLELLHDLLREVLPRAALDRV